MLRIRRIVLGAVISLGVILGIYTTVHGMSVGVNQGKLGSHYENIYARSSSADFSTTSSLNSVQSDQTGRGHGCDSDYQHTAPDD